MKDKLISILMSHTNLNYIEAEGVVEEMMGAIKNESIETVERKILCKSCHKEIKGTMFKFENGNGPLHQECHLTRGTI